MSHILINTINKHITSILFYLNKRYIIVGVSSFLFFSVGDNAVLAQKIDTVYYYDNGVVSSEGMMEDGQPNGYWKTYYPNGQIKSEGNRENFKLDSTWFFYDKEGLKTSKINYTAGKKGGKVTTYRNGAKYEVSIFENGQKTEFTKTYYATGELRKKVPYEDGKEKGSGYIYETDGRIITLLEFKEGYLRSSQQVNRYTDQGRKRGPWIEFHDNGVMAMEGYFMNGRKNGIFKTYDRKGDLLTLEKYRDDELVVDSEESVILDVRSTYYKDGTVKSTGGYVNGEKEGTHRIYDKDGNIESGEIYKRGTKTAEGIVDKSGNFEGDWKLFYNCGELRAEGTYESSQRTGDWIFYHKNGEVEHQAKYMEGEPQGEWKWFFNNGDLRRKEYYRRGKEDGLSLEKDRDGNTITKGEYINGYKEGEWFYHVGDHTEKGEYLDGERQGEWIYEYPDGDLHYEGEYRAGLEVGKHTWYHPNGQKKKEGKYTSGIRTGTWKTYDKNGIETLEVKYKNGREFKINGRKVAERKVDDEEEVQ